MKNYLSLIKIAKVLDSNGFYKQSSKIDQKLFKLANTENEGPTLEQIKAQSDLERSISNIPVKPIKIEPAERKRYTKDDMAEFRALQEELSNFIDTYISAIDSGDEKFYLNYDNMMKYGDLYEKVNSMAVDISLSLPRLTNPIIEPNTPEEYKSWRGMNEEKLDFSDSNEKLKKKCSDFKQKLSRYTPIPVGRRHQPATSGYVIPFHPSLTEMGIHQGTFKRKNSRMHDFDSDYFFIVPTKTGRRVIELPNGYAFVKIEENGQTYFDLPPNQKERIMRQIQRAQNEE
jgi:hypothetical protein